MITSLFTKLFNIQISFLHMNLHIIIRTLAFTIIHVVIKFEKVPSASLLVYVTVHIQKKYQLNVAHFVMCHYLYRCPQWFVLGLWPSHCCVIKTNAIQWQVMLQLSLPRPLTTDNTWDKSQTWHYSSRAFPEFHWGPFDWLSQFREWAREEKSVKAAIGKCCGISSNLQKMSKSMTVGTQRDVI